MVTLQAALAAMVLSGTGQTVLLDFYTDWCGSCKAMNPAVQRLEKAGCAVQRVNADQNKALAAKYGVRAFPTFVMLADGKEVDRVVGGTSDSRLELMWKRGVSAAAAEPSPVMLAQNGPPGTQAASPPAPLSSPFDERGSRSVPIQPVSMPARSPAVAADATLIAATVRLRVKDANGTSCGSGTIIDARGGQALVLTCGHIFRDSQGKGPITVDLFGPNGPQQVLGTLYSYDLDRDVGLVVINALGRVATARVAPPGYRLARGAPVISVGCDNGDAPTARHSQITALDGIQSPPTIQIAGQSVEGRSGGGLFSADGYVIGVCYAADPSYNEALFAATGSIYAELDRKGLSALYRAPGGTADGMPETAAASALARNTMPPMPRAMPGTLESGKGDRHILPERPEGCLAQNVPVTFSGTALPTHEQAALDEIRRHVKEGAEVVCIIRSRENPAAKSEVIMLDHTSPEFIRQLSLDARPQDKPYQTSLELRAPRKKLLEWSAPGTNPADGGWIADGQSDARRMPTGVK